MEDDADRGRDGAPQPGARAGAIGRGGDVPLAAASTVPGRRGPDPREASAARDARDAGADPRALAVAPTRAGSGAPGPLADGSDPSTWDLPDADRAAGGDARGPRGAPATLDPGEPAPGAAIGRFVVRRRLGAGGMGVVFAADDADLGRPVAIKLVRGDAGGGLRARLLREAQAMARLEHPNVVRVLEVGADGGRLFVAMELIDGDTLTRWLAAPRPWPEVVAMFAQVGAGLAAVHHAGLVHRDFKPDNVLVDRGGRARVADFGLARFDPERAGSASPALAAPLTRTGALMGTPGFMAPEQQFGADVDARADQYSFCVALRGGLGDGWAAAPAGVRAAVTRGLSYDASERFASMDELLAAIDQAAGRAAAPAGARARRGVLIGGAAAVAAAGAVAAIALVATRADAPRSGALAPPTTGAAAPAAVQDAALIAAAQAPAIAAAAARDAGPPPLPGALADAIAIHDATVPAAQRFGTGTRDAGAPGPAAATGRDAGAGRLATGATASATAARDAGVTLLPPVPFVDLDAGAPRPPTVHPKPGPMPPGDLPAVRAVTRDLGYRGLPLGELDADIPGSIANFERSRDGFVAEAKDDDLRIPIASAGLAMMRRRAGDCRRARAEAQAALHAFGKHGIHQGDTQALLWWGRAWFVVGLCTLEAGDAAGAIDPLHQAVQFIGWGGGGDVQQSEVQLADGIAILEAGDRVAARGALHAAGVNGDDAVHHALEAYMKSVNMTWGETWQSD